MWDVSCAGHVTAGDSNLQAAVRELKEELGLFVQPEDLEWIFTIESHYVLNNGTYLDNELVDVYLLKKNISIKLLTLQPDAEGRAVPWLRAAGFWGVLLRALPFRTRGNDL